MKHLFVCSLLTASLLLPAAAFAHGVDVSDVTGQAGVRTVRFGYTDGEFMLFAKVKVYPPSTPDATVQESMTDRDGYFSFVPFENGDWRLTAEDGMGHMGEIVVTVADGTTQEAASQTENAAPSNRLPRLIAIALGLSVIFNVFAFWYLTGRKLKKKGKPADGSPPGAAHAH
jgi:nickel transport protein